MIRKPTAITFLALIALIISFESVLADQQEQKLIQQNQEAAKSSTNKAMFVVHRIKCMTSNDRTALIACNKALSINPNEASLRKRKVLLSNKLNPKPKQQIVRKAPAPVRKIKPQIKKAPTTVRKTQPLVKKTPTPKKIQIAKKIPKPIKTIALKTSSQKAKAKTLNDKKKTIIKIQQSLNHLGFNVGRPDGIAGKNTKLAIDNFQSLTKSKNNKLGEKLLLELQKAQKHHDIANQKYTLAKQQLKDGNLEGASTSIYTYLKNAPWHTDLQSLQKDLKQQVSLKEQNNKQKEISEQLTTQNKTVSLPLKSKLETKENPDQKELTSLIELAQTQFAMKDIEKATSTINKAKLINPSNEVLLSLKNNIEIYKNEVQANKEKDETLSILYARALKSFDNNELDSAVAFVDKGLTLESTHPKLLELKSKISIKTKETINQENKIEAVAGFYNEALVSFNNFEFDTAISSINEGLSLDANNLELLELKAKVLSKQTEVDLQKDKDKKLTSLYSQASESFNQNKIEIAIATLNQGLSLDSSNLKLLELKANVLAKQNEIQLQKNTDEKLAILYSQASTNLLKNKIDAALALVDEGLALDPNKLNLLELKRDIFVKRDELTTLEKNNQKISKLLSLISEKQDLIETISKKLQTEQQPLLNKAQQTIKEFYAKPNTSESSSKDTNSTARSIATSKTAKPIYYLVELESLPLNIGKNWLLSRNAESNMKCALSYRKVSMSDGQGGTQVVLRILKDRIIFKSEANIDNSYEQTGISIDNMKQLPIETLLNEFSISYEQQYKKIIKDMISAKIMTLSLGFWPTWPVTKTHSVNFSLDDFSSAQKALISCIKLEDKT